MIRYTECRLYIEVATWFVLRFVAVFAASLRETYPQQHDVRVAVQYGRLSVGATVSGGHAGKQRNSASGAGRSGLGANGTLRQNL